MTISRPETGAQHISWSQGRSTSCSPPWCPCLVTGAFFLSSLSASFSDVVHYSGTECSFSLLSLTSVPPSSVLDTTKHFLAFIENQYHTSVQLWMSDSGREYKSRVFDNLLKNKGISILQSILHMPQQNGHAKRLMCTLSDKAECIQIDACIPESWWNFTLEHTCYLSWLGKTTKSLFNISFLFLFFSFRLLLR